MDTNFPTLPGSLQIPENGSVYDAINGAYFLRASYQERPQKPVIEKNADSDMVLRYQKQLKGWELKMEHWTADRKRQQEHNLLVDNLIVEFIKKASGLYDIPEKYQSGVYSFAWDEGHSSGFYEVYLMLCRLVSIFE